MFGFTFYSFLIQGGGDEDFSNFRFSFPDVHRSLQKTPTINTVTKTKHTIHIQHIHTFEHDLQVQSRAKLLQFGVLAFKIEVKEREREREKEPKKKPKDLRIKTKWKRMQQLRQRALQSKGTMIGRS